MSAQIPHEKSEKFPNVGLPTIAHCHNNNQNQQFHCGADTNTSLSQERSVE